MVQWALHNLHEATLTRCKQTCFFGVSLRLETPILTFYPCFLLFPVRYAPCRDRAKANLQNTKLLQILFLALTGRFKLGGA